jgi:hypothetical protein
VALTGKESSLGRVSHQAVPILSSYFVAIVWMALTAPFIVNATVFINLHPRFVLGEVVNALTIAVLARTITSWWRGTYAKVAIARCPVVG